MIKEFIACKEVHAKINGVLTELVLETPEACITYRGTFEYAISHFAKSLGGAFTCSLGMACKDLEEDKTKEVYKIVDTQKNETVGYIYL